jgi:hypothetical protein
VGKEEIEVFVELVFRCGETEWAIVGKGGFEKVVKVAF